MNRPLDPETLLSHTGWVRQLARTLVADDPTADDLTQDAMVAALEHPPRTGEPGTSLRAWLSTVTRHLAVRRGRENTRRDERERRVARPDELPSVDRVLEREGIRRRLVEHVLALDEPYRETILLRYFDELPPVEIASRLGVNGSTVRNRLSRGLALLHERLQREHGEGWQQWCLLIVPAGSGGTQVPLSSLTGSSGFILAMGTKLVLFLLSFAAALATIFSWRAIERDEAAPIEEVAASAPAQHPVAPVIPDPGEQADAHDRAPGAEASDPFLAGTADPFGLLCYGAVRSKDGEAITSGTVWIEDRLGRQRECAVDSRGWYSFAGIALGSSTLRAACDGFRPFDMTVDLTKDDRVARHDLVLDAATILNIRIRGRPEVKPPHTVRLTVVATRDLPPPKIAEAAARSHRRYGIGEYQGREPFGGQDDRIAKGYDGILQINESLPCCVSLVLRHLVIETKLVPFGATEVEFEVDPSAVTRLLARARVRVVDAMSGTPLHPAEVELNPCDVGGGGVPTDEDGVAVFENLLPGPLELAVRAKDHAWFQRAVEVESGQLTDLGTLRIPASSRVAGRAIDESGAPVAIDLTWIDASATGRPDRFRDYETTRSDSQGRFEFPSVPRGELILWSLPAGLEQAHTCVAVDTSPGDQVDVILRVERGRMVGLRFEGPGTDPIAWVLRRSDGVALMASNWTPSGPMPLRLADGAYRVEVWRNGIAVRTQELRVSRDDELFQVNY